MQASVGLDIDKRYKLIKKIGEGGMGAVYLAHQTHVDRQVVLKILKPNLCSNEEQVQRFKREAQLASQLSHPNSVITYDFNIYRGMPYIAMEALEGEPLSDLLERDETISVEKTVHILKQVCASLKEAHEKGMVHRDLKPENIFLLSNPVDQYDVKVLDFGIAKLMTHHPNAQKSNLTRNDMIYGTPQYMSPEQIRGKDVDARADVYAIAVIVHQCLLGTLPYDSEVVVDILTQHLTQPVPQVTNSHSIFDQGTLIHINKIMQVGMAKNLHNRITSVEEMGELLDELLQTVQPIEVEVEPIKKTSPSSKLFWGIVLLAIGFVYACPKSPISPFPSWHQHGWRSFVPYRLGKKLELWFPHLEISDDLEEFFDHTQDTLTAELVTETSTKPKLQVAPIDQTSKLNTYEQTKTKTHGVIRVESPTKDVKVYLGDILQGTVPTNLVVQANQKHQIICEYEGQYQKKEIVVGIKKLKRIICFRSELPVE